MMKKLIMLLTICMMCLLAVSASAAEKNDEAPPINWEISMMPKPRIVVKRNINILMKILKIQVWK